MAFVPKKAAGVDGPGDFSLQATRTEIASLAQRIAGRLSLLCLLGVLALIVQGNAHAQNTVTMGVTTVFETDDANEGDVLLAQEASLSQAATLQSLSVFVTNADGNPQGPGHPSIESAAATTSILGGNPFSGRSLAPYMVGSPNHRRFTPGVIRGNNYT
jgi:hypothetical protein